MLFSVVLGQDCDDGWQPHGSHCYYVTDSTEDDQLSWHYAREWCQIYGGDLASIHSDEERDFITSIVSIQFNYFNYLTPQETETNIAL
jgi:hypothetical protein